MTYRLRILGGLELSAPGGGEIRAILAQPKRLALLVYLALAPSPRYRRRDVIISLFWPDLDQEHARGALRQALRFLRRQLGEALFVSRGEEEVGVDSTVLQCDAVQFQDAIDSGRTSEALGLYRGDLLDGVFVSDAAPDWDQWLDRERGRFRHLAAGAAWTLAEELRGAGDQAGAAGAARRAAGFAPDDEGELRRLMVFLDDLGNRSAALAAYDHFARRLQQDYGATPAPETWAILEAVRHRTGPAPAPQPPPGEAGARAPDVAIRPARLRMLIALAAVGVLAVGAYLAAFGRSRARANQPVVVAVLPMEDLEGDSTTTYLVEGLTDQLITDLAQAPGLQVINRRTTSLYRGSTKVPRTIARELGAGAVLSSTLQRLADTVLVNAQLTLAADDRAIWAQDYRGSRADLLRMQREIARAVSQRLRHPSAELVADAPSGSRPYHPEALDLYIKGRYWWNKRGPGLLQSIQFFDQALQLDPTFALAYSGMADAYVQLGYGSLLPPGDAFPKAREAARRALALDSSLAEPHATLGYTAMYYDWDWSAAEREFQHALALNPSYATAHEWYGLFLAAMGRFTEAREHEQQAQALDPLSSAIGGTAAWVLYYSGQFEAAERELKIALRMDPGYTLGHFYLSRVYLAQGRTDSALVESAATGPLRAWVPTIAGEAYIRALRGERDNARETLVRLDSLSRSQYVTGYAVSLVHVALGQSDSAFAWLDRAVAERTHWLVWLNRDDRWKPIRQDARFRMVVQRVGLPP